MMRLTNMFKAYLELSGFDRNTIKAFEKKRDGSRVSSKNVSNAIQNLESLSVDDEETLVVARDAMLKVLRLCLPS